MNNEAVIADIHEALDAISEMRGSDPADGDYTERVINAGVMVGEIRAPYASRTLMVKQAAVSYLQRGDTQQAACCLRNEAIRLEGVEEAA